MRLLTKTLAAACVAAAATAAIAGCGPAEINGVTPASNASGVTPAVTSNAAAATSQAATSPPAAPAVTSQTTGAVDSTSAGSGPAATSGTGAAITALSIVMTLPINRPLQTTAVIAGRLTEPDNGNAPLAGRVVWLERVGAGGWLLFRAGLTGPDGGIAFQVHVVVGAAFRLVYLGTPSLDRAVSPIRVVVR